MKCKKCGYEMEQGSFYCSRCGQSLEERSLELQEEKASEQEKETGKETEKETEKKPEKETEKTESGTEEKKKVTVNSGWKEGWQEFCRDFWPPFTEDEYRNRLVKSVRFLNLWEAVILIACITSAWRYRPFYGWIVMVLVTLACLWMLGFVEKLIGRGKYFGPEKVESYDRLVASQGKVLAEEMLEGRKWGLLRKVLFGLLVLCSFGITDGICGKVASFYMGDMESESDESNFQVGETVTTGDFECCVTNAYVRDFLGFDKNVPEGAIYVVVEYEYKNVSGRPISSSDLPEVFLLDGNDAVYDIDADASWYLDSYRDAKLISNLNPGIKTRDAEIFEVAIDVLNAGGMRAYISADRDFMVDLPLYYEAPPYGKTGNAAIDGLNALSYWIEQNQDAGGNPADGETEEGISK